MIKKYLYPLISAICITNRRPEFLLRAIINFDAQNYPNRELVVSYPRNDIGSKTLLLQIQQVAEINLILMERDEDMTIGSARNEAINASNGEYICSWDDDDWHRDVRLMYQFTVLRAAKQKREASVLTKVVLYDSLKDRVCISPNLCWSGTLLCKKEIALKHPYQDTNFGEEADLINYLRSSLYLCYFDNHNIYGFIFHGKNVLSSKQFSRFFDKQPLLDEYSKYWFLSQINIKPLILAN